MKQSKWKRKRKEKHVNEGNEGWHKVFYRRPVSKGTERAVMNTYTYSTVYLFTIIFISLLLPYTMAPLIRWMNYKDNAINARLWRWRKIRLKLRKHTKRKKKPFRFLSSIFFFFWLKAPLILSAFSKAHLILHQSTASS